MECNNLHKVTTPLVVQQSVRLAVNIMIAASVQAIMQLSGGHQHVPQQSWGGGGGGVCSNPLAKGLP